jgi:AcrR family transcriptional regulator
MINQTVKSADKEPVPPTEVGTEQRIFEAARQSFIEKGLEGAKMQEIADRAGINKALLHYYFRTKEKLFEAVTKQVIGRVFPVLRNMLESDLPLEEKLDNLIDLYVDIVSRNTFVPLFVITEMNKRPDNFLANIVPGPLPKPQKLVEQLELATAEGRIRPIEPAHLISNVLAMCVFPFLAKPMLCAVMGMDDQHWQHYVNERKAEVKRFVHGALRP